MWSIRVLSGPQAGQIYDLKLGKNVFGRGGASDLKIQSLGISKEHCEIHVYKDKMMIVDLKSSNGTFVNGVKIQNSIVRVGDKVSLFDVIMDVIPAPDIRPKNTPKVEVEASEEDASEKPKRPARRPRPPAPMGGGFPAVPNGGAFPVPYPQQGNAALQMQYPQMGMNPVYGAPPQFNPAAGAAPAAPAAAPKLTLSQTIENYIENVVMPAIYRLGIIFSLKQILMGFVMIFVFGVTFLSAIPLSNLIQESNMMEATKRARSVARSIAKFNEQSLLSGQLGNLTVQEALKEEGIKEAFIIQQQDGLIVAPADRVGRDEANALVLKARQEGRATSMRLNKDTLGASFPIAVYDPNSGEALPKYHAVVLYDISSLNVDSERVVSLLMQTLLIASFFGLILYYLFARLIEYPIKTLNQQIDKALLEKSDRTEVAFDYPVFQQLVSSVNTILNRVWSGGGDLSQSLKPQQNRDVEYSNLVEMIFHPAVVLDFEHKVRALNPQFEELAQTSREAVLNQSYQTLTDGALVQNIEALVARAQQSPYEKHSDRIPFSQFECDVYCQAFLNAEGQPESYVITLVQIS